MRHHCTTTPQPARAPLTTHHAVATTCDIRHRGPDPLLPPVATTCVVLCVSGQKVLCCRLCVSEHPRWCFICPWRIVLRPALHASCMLVGCMRGQVAVGCHPLCHPLCYPLCHPQVAVGCGSRTLHEEPHRPPDRPRNRPSVLPLAVYSSAHSNAFFLEVFCR